VLLNVVNVDTSNRTDFFTPVKTSFDFYFDTADFDGGKGQNGDVIITANHGRTGGDIGFTIHNSSGRHADVSSGIRVEPGQSYHVIATYNQGGDGMKLYVDGWPVGSNTYNSESFKDWGSGQNWYIGRSNWPQDPYFKGEVDYLLIHNYALADVEVLEQYLRQRD